ncbi:asparagine synthase (glutamine-hydrolyzing) [Patescibacteria group bacterium]|nr:asparagine synthase (glutamine-hydrolyzing) [Patescibacteria group bacterium]MBP9709683.1 asparagine synthase (glutamine-hydrolyzing) [Patescibacteria group bacterium]
MCGIAGYWRWDGQPADEDRLRRMGEAIAHRGPDGEGSWVEGGIGLAHRRLAIIDVSQRGAQPMVSADERYVITFNGEIYNYQALKQECESRGMVFRSDSDTEVLLQLYARKGEKMLADLRGMFAFAIWDREARRLFVARDRIGKKPFFYRQTATAFSFASELKGLLVDQSANIDLNAIRVFLGLQYVPAPLTGFEGIMSLPPGYAGICENGTWKVWKYDDVFSASPFTGTFAEAKDQIRVLLEESIRLRLIADVPIGAFLSGGIDSSAIVALAEQSLGTPLTTFTMGFPALGFDERDQAATFAKERGLPHYSFEAKPGHAREALDTLVSLYESPYADSSALPTWMLARETAKEVKVVLTGDGADELFAGYRRYGYFSQALTVARLGGKKIIPWIKRASSSIHDPRVLRFARTLEAIQRSPEAGYAALFTGAYFSQADELTLLQSDFLQRTQVWSAEGWIEGFIKERKDTIQDPLHAALTFDRMSYLPDDLNVKMDRATMAHGLEARAPFLDQELSRFVSSLPSDWLRKGSQGKYILRQVLEDVLPKKIMQRKKRGFQVPLASWFRGELRPVFEERCLSVESPLRPICKLEAIKQILHQNDRGADHGNRLWMLLTLATWLQQRGGVAK